MTVPGLVSLFSRDGFSPTVDRLDAALAKRGITPLLRLDHAAAANSAGLMLSPLLLIVFGDPKVGTPVMKAAPTAGIDLPLKILVWASPDGATCVGYNEPAWIGARHGLAQPSAVADRMATLLQELTLSAAGADRS